MHLIMALEILFQLFSATDVTLNMLMAGLVVCLEAFHICESFHAAWFAADNFYVVQLDCTTNTKSLSRQR